MGRDLKRFSIRQLEISTSMLAPLRLSDFDEMLYELNLHRVSQNYKHGLHITTWLAHKQHATGKSRLKVN